MLGKTAGGLFWMYRQLERAENTVRMIDTGQRIALTRLRGADDEWASVLQSAGVYAGYLEKHGELRKDLAIDWMLRDRDNASSVYSSVAQARMNARLVRTALTDEVWEAVNGCYMRAKDLLSRKVNERDLPAVLSTVRQRTGLVRGATHGTMLRNDIYDFARIGTFIERSDNTARILDVKYYVLLPTSFAVGSGLDNVQWESILRSIGSEGGYRMIYGQDVAPRDIARFLILDRRMPRSLSFCAHKLRDNLGYLSKDYGRTLKSAAMSDKLCRRFMSHDIDAIFDYGLHEYIEDILSSLVGFSRQIEVDFRFYE